MKKSALFVALSIALVSLASLPAAQAGQLGSIADEARLRFLSVTPIEGGDLNVPSGDVNIESDLTPELDLTHYYTKNFATELVLATSKHSVNTTQSTSIIGETDLGDVSLLPPTVLAQYHFLPDDYFQPYVGAGVNYTFFYNEGQNTTVGAIDSVDYDNSFGWALQAGFDVQLDSLSDRMALNVDVKKLYLNTDVSVENSVGGSVPDPVKADVDIDPILFGVGISYEI